MSSATTASVAAVSGPSAAPALEPAPSTPFLQNLRINHGPIPEIGAFLLRCATALGERGIELRLAPISEIVRINTLEYASWGPFTPILDTRVANLTEDDSYCMLGRNRAGRIVAAQAGRIFDTGGRSLRDLADDQSLYYGPDRKPGPEGPTCIVTAPVASELRGRLVYSGALWVHPDARGLGLASVLPRLSRVYALGRFDTDVTFAFVSDKISKTNLFKSYGYRKLEPSYSIYYGATKTYDGSLMWMERDELIADMQEFLSTRLPEIDRRIGAGGGEQQAVAV